MARNEAVDERVGCSECDALRQEVHAQRSAMVALEKQVSDLRGTVQALVQSVQVDRQQHMGSLHQVRAALREHEERWAHWEQHSIKEQNDSVSRRRNNPDEAGAHRPPVSEAAGRGWGSARDRMPSQQQQLSGGEGEGAVAVPLSRDTEPARVGDHVKDDVLLHWDEMQRMQQQHEAQLRSQQDHLGALQDLVMQLQRSQYALETTQQQQVHQQMVFQLQQRKWQHHWQQQQQQPQQPQTQPQHQPHSSSPPQSQRHEPPVSSSDNHSEATPPQRMLPVQCVSTASPTVVAEGSRRSVGSRWAYSHMSCDASHVSEANDDMVHDARFDNDYPSLDILLSPRLEEEDDDEALTKRQKLVLEVLESEQVYVDNLRVLMDHYLAPISDSLGSDPMISQDDWNFMFRDVALIANLNRTMLAELEKRITLDTPDAPMADVLVRFAPMFKMYTAYCGRLNATFDRIDELCKSNSRFNAHLDDMCASSVTKHRPIGAFIIMPMQRVPRYVLLLQELLKATPPHHEEYTELESALTQFRTVAEALNQYVEREQRLGKMRSLQLCLTGYPGQIIAPTRILVNEGLLTRVTAVRLVEDYYFLFNDMLVCTRRRSALGRSWYTYKGRIVLHTAWVREAPDVTPSVRNVMNVVTPHKTYTFCCRTAEERSEWLQHLTSCIDVLVAQKPSLVQYRGRAKPPKFSKFGRFRGLVSEEDDGEGEGEGVARTHADMMRLGTLVFGGGDVGVSSSCPPSLRGSPMLSRAHTTTTSSGDGHGNHSAHSAPVASPLVSFESQHVGDALLVVVFVPNDIAGMQSVRVRVNVRDTVPMLLTRVRKKLRHTEAAVVTIMEGQVEKCVLVNENVAHVIESMKKTECFFYRPRKETDPVLEDVGDDVDDSSTSLLLNEHQTIDEDVKPRLGVDPEACLLSPCGAPVDLRFSVGSVVGATMSKSHGVVVHESQVEQTVGTSDEIRDDEAHECDAL